MEPIKMPMTTQLFITLAFILLGMLLISVMLWPSNKYKTNNVIIALNNSQINALTEAIRFSSEKSDSLNTSADKYLDSAWASDGKTFEAQSTRSLYLVFCRADRERASYWRGRKDAYKLILEIINNSSESK